MFDRTFVPQTNGTSRLWFQTDIAYKTEQIKFAFTKFFTSHPAVVPFLGNKLTSSFMVTIHQRSYTKKGVKMAFNFFEYGTPIVRDYMQDETCFLYPVVCMILQEISDWSGLTISMTRGAPSGSGFCEMVLLCTETDNVASDV